LELDPAVFSDGLIFSGSVDLIVVNWIVIDWILALHSSGLVSDIDIVVSFVLFINVIAYYWLDWAQAVVLQSWEVQFSNLGWGIGVILNDSVVCWDFDGQRNCGV